MQTLIQNTVEYISCFRRYFV